MHSNLNPSQNGTPLAAGHNGWTHLYPREGAAYIHLHDSDNSIVRLDREAQLVTNGSAPQLKPNRRIEPIDFDPTIQSGSAVRELKVLVADFLPVHPNQRWTVISWLLTAFFSDLVRQRALLRVAGEPGSGKSTTAGLLSCLLYGTGNLDGGRPEKALEENDPLLVVEQDDGDPNRLACDSSLDELLLDLAQGTARSRSLALVTGRGEFAADELNLWAYRVDCSSEFHDPAFLSGTHFGEVIRHRGRVLSGLFQLFAREVVPGLDYRRTQILEKIRQEFPGHCHNQLDCFLALMAVILEALLGALHGSGSRGDYEAWRMVRDWISGQGRIRQHAHVRDRASFLFFSLAQALSEGELEVYEYLERNKLDNGEEFGLSFETCPSEMFRLLESVGEEKGVKVPFETPRELAAFLEKESSQNEVRLSWTKTKVRRGEPFYEFFKEF